MGFDSHLYLCESSVGECFGNLQALKKLHVVDRV